jgi:transcriptional regulator with XRE-family HTH domain
MAKKLKFPDERWQEAFLRARSAKDLPEDMRQEFVRRLAKLRAEADPSNLIEVLTRELWWRINAEDESITDIADRAGIHLSQLSRFLSGERSVSLDAASKLAEALDLVLVLKPKAKKEKP